MKKFSESLREHTKRCNLLLKEKKVTINKKELKSHQDAMEC